MNDDVYEEIDETDVLEENFTQEGLGALLSTGSIINSLSELCGFHAIHLPRKKYIGK